MRTLLFVLLAVIGNAFAAPPIADYLRPPEFRLPLLSPDGAHLAVLVPAKGRMNLATVDLATRKPVLLTGYEKYDVVDVHWVGNDRLVFTLGHFDTPVGESYGGGGLYTIRRDGTEARAIPPVAVNRGLSYARAIPGSDDEIIASGWVRSRDSVDLYRLNLRTGRAELISPDRPVGRATGWGLDDALVPRIVFVAEERELRTRVYYRPTAEAPWQVISILEREGGPAFVPVRIEPDGKTLIVLGREEGETRGLYRLDIASGKPIEKLAVHPRFDMDASSLILSLDRSRILGYQVEAEQRQVSWIDPDYARVQQAIDRALPNRVNLIQRRPATKRTLVTSYSDRQPHQFYLFDEEKRTLEELFMSRPWLKPDDLVEMRPFLLKTRDGLQIPSYVFIPSGRKPGERLPTVVSIHGGPEVRADTWGYATLGAVEAQLLASRGYAVVLPNFRITPGLGRTIHAAGFRELGRKMQEDHEDATQWAIDEGIADPARICIYGGSYGGYAALMGVIKTPDLYRCSIAGYAVTDFEAMMSSPNTIYSYRKTTPAYYRSLIGDPSTERELFQAIAPARHADKIKAAIFLIVGGEDVIVPPEQSRTMRRALEAAGKPPRWLLKVEEGHGFRKLENRVEEFEQIFKFLDEHIGAGRKP